MAPECIAHAAVEGLERAVQQFELDQGRREKRHPLDFKTSKLIQSGLRERYSRCSAVARTTAAAAVPWLTRRLKMAPKSTSMFEFKDL